jgi:hypothetical protein
MQQDRNEPPPFTLVQSTEVAMVLNAHTDPMTEEQRQELKRLCDAADIPDKSGELLTRSGAQQMIEELRRKAAQQRA